GTAGIATFKTGLTSPDLNLGDKVIVTGAITHYNGLTEIIPVNDGDIILLSSNEPLPVVEELTLAQLKSNPEIYESRLIGIRNLTKVSGQWPLSGSSVNLQFTDGTDSIVVRIDSDTEIDGTPEPQWPRDFVGVLTQFDN